LHQILRFIHCLTKCQHNLLDLVVQLLPDQGFHSIRVVKTHYLHPVRLTVAVQPTHTLVQPHWIPRQVDMDETVTTLLKVDTLAASLRRDEEPILTTVKLLSSDFAALVQGPRSTQQIKDAGMKDLNVILKGDVQCSVQVIADTLGKMSTEKVRVRVLHSGVGAITESDVLLAAASNAISPNDSDRLGTRTTSAVR